MKALIQRVSSSQVNVSGKKVGSIEKGLLVFLGLEKQDTRPMAEKMIINIISYRVFRDQYLKINLSVGTITLLISIAVLILWIPLGQKLGMATILNALIIALMIDLCIKFVPTPSNYYNQLILGVVSVITVGIGGGIYLVSNLGAGPRDGLMVGLQKKTNLPIALVRATLEITVVSIGWYLGGTVGIGTLLFAFGIGPAVAFGLYLVDKIFN